MNDGFYEAENAMVLKDGAFVGLAAFQAASGLWYVEHTVGGPFGKGRHYPTKAIAEVALKVRSNVQTKEKVDGRSKPCQERSK